MQIAQLKQQLRDIGQHRWVASLAVVIMTLFIVGLLFSTVKALWFSHKTLVKTITTPTITHQPLASSLPSMHLLGNSGANFNDLPLASLALQVQGIFMNQQASKSRALISMTGQAPQMYNVGAMLPGNVKIYKITKNSVIVSHNNQLEKLPFSLQGINFATTTTHQGLFK